MFKRIARLPASVLAGGLPEKAIIRPFLVRFSKNGLGYNRFAAIVGMGFEKTAAGRHRWQRQIREKLKKWPALGLDAAVFPLPEAKGKNCKTATAALSRGFLKIET